MSGGREKVVSGVHGGIQNVVCGAVVSEQGGETELVFGPVVKVEVPFPVAEKLVVPTMQKHSTFSAFPAESVTSKDDAHAGSSSQSSSVAHAIKPGPADSVKLAISGQKCQS